jgi:hypothetical protein
MARLGMLRGGAGMIERVHDTPRGAIRYWVDALPGDAPALVFLPGLTADHRLFEKQIECFAGKYSLVIFCFHAVECPFFPWKTFEPFIQDYGQLANFAIFLVRAGILLLITRCVIGIDFFKKIFGYR